MHKRQILLDLYKKRKMKRHNSNTTLSYM